MATTITTTLVEEEEEEDYIDMELSSNILCFSKVSSSPQNNKDFEFQMTSNYNENETNTFLAADQLFHKGKLVPLHLLKLEQEENEEIEEEVENYYKMVLPLNIKCSTAPCTNTTNTPLDSCNISPSQSCRVSCELNPDEYFFEWSTEFISTLINNNNHHQTKKSWTSKKLKLIRTSILGQKIKASRSYFKSLFFFNKSQEKLQKTQESANDYIKSIAKKTCSSYPTIATIMENIDKEDKNNNINVPRRSFSGAIKRHSPVKCLSTSSSSSSGVSSTSSSSNSSSLWFNSKELYFFRRSGSAKEIEGSIEAAIAHCKKEVTSV